MTALQAGVMLAVREHNRRHGDKLRLRSLVQDGVEVKYLVNDEQFPPGFRPAFEFRNQGWFADDVYECLRRFDAALCIAEHEDYSVPFEPTADFGYFRLRKP